MFLTEDEIYRLTKKRRHDAQVRQLDKLAIIYKVRADGSIIILQEHVENVLGIKREKNVSVKYEPNWNAQ